MNKDEVVKHLFEYKDTYISALSFIVAFFAWLTSISSKKVAQEAKNIAEREFNSKNSSLELTINDNYRLKMDCDYLCYSVSIKSESYVNDGLSLVELNLKYSNSDGFANEVYLSPMIESDLDDEISSRIKILHSQICFSPRETVSGTLVFKVPEAMSDTARIESSTIIVKNAKGVSSIASSYLMRSFDSVQ